MTKRNALEILIRWAARGAGGVGQGVSRGVAEGAERAELIEAIRKLWPYGYPLDASSLRNLGL